MSSEIDNVRQVWLQEGELKLCISCGSCFLPESYWLFVYPLGILAPETIQSAQLFIQYSWRAGYERFVAFCAESREGWLCKYCFETQANQIKEALR